MLNCRRCTTKWASFASLPLRSRSAATELPLAITGSSRLPARGTGGIGRWEPGAAAFQLAMKVRNDASQERDMLWRLRRVSLLI